MGDRMAGAHGIENRCPFLDRHIIDFAFSLPHNFENKKFRTKNITEKTFKKEKIIQPNKNGKKRSNNYI